MKIVDTVPYFLENYQPSINFLRNYYSSFPDIFKEYFLYHCKDTEERHEQSIQMYPQVMHSIQEAHRNIVPLLQEIEKSYLNLYDVSFPIDVNLIVGGFGSNAYTYRQIIPNVTFALERLSSSVSHLKVIIAHEFGHLTQNILSDKASIEWSKVNWNSPLTWLFQEGAATHFSRKTVPGLSPSIYFSYDDHGEEWLQYALQHKDEIKVEFAKALKKYTPQEIFQEWFSINGGRTFGYSRLGYFLGDLLLQEKILKVGELNAIVAWEDHGFEESIQGWVDE